MAKTAIDYDISLAYHAEPYHIYSKHHGIDYAAPTGTNVVVSEQKIAETGNTGDSTEPHLHVDKANRYPASALFHYRSPRDWRNITGRVIFAGKAGTAGNMVVIKADNGFFYRFLHLDKIFVKVGDIIGDVMISRRILNVLTRFFWGRDATPAEVKNNVGKRTPDQVWRRFLEGNNYAKRKEGVKSTDYDISRHLPTELRNNSVLFDEFQKLKNGNSDEFEQVTDISELGLYRKKNNQ